MKNTIIFSALIGLIAFTAGLYINRPDISSAEVPQEEVSENHHNFTVKVYKSPTCGCCNQYIAYLREEGFDVEKIEMSYDELEDLKRDHGIPEDVESCHTAIWGDHAVEGHIPLEAIKELGHGDYDGLGIGMGGMPAGSPGMGGYKSEPFEIYSFDSDGEMELFMTL